MIVASCPLRVSLVGGGTDHPLFLEKYHTGKVISFASNLRVYVTLHEDIAGLNKLKKKYIINYTQREEVDYIDGIKNDIVRETLKYFNIDTPLTISLTSDVSSAGSGLASSSAYIIALVEAILFKFKNNKKDINDACRIAHEIERKINPLVGEQDFYGSVYSSLKKLTFTKNLLPEVDYLPNIFSKIKMALIHTGVYRSSSEILKTIDIDKNVPLLAQVDQMFEAITINDLNKCYDIINISWEMKKKTSPSICENPYVKDLDFDLYQNQLIKCHKLLGAGNGGYFLIMFENSDALKDSMFRNKTIIPIEMARESIKIIEI